MRIRYGLAVLIVMGTGVMGCKQPAPEPPIWEQVKIGDLASDQSTQGEKPKLDALNIGIHVYCVPAGNVKKLKDLWELLRLRGPRYENLEVFHKNGFRVARARITAWDSLALALTRAQAQQERTVSFLLTPGFDSDLPLVNLSMSRDVAFTGIDESDQHIRLGPGTIAWRIKVEKSVTDLREPKLAAYPVFKLAGVSSVLDGAGLAESTQIAFMCSAFSIRMGFGDIIVLGPEETLGDASTLGGLFFGVPNHVFLGLDSNEPVKTCPAVRVFVLTCQGTQ